MKTTLEKYRELQQRDIAAKTKEEFDAIEVEMAKLADEDPEGFEQAVLHRMRETLSDAKKLKIKEQMKAVSDIVSMSYIAKTYFCKTKSWLSQRINELNVNGKPVTFTSDEIDTLNYAFEDIGKKIGTFRVSC